MPNRLAVCHPVEEFVCVCVCISVDVERMHCVSEYKYAQGLVEKTCGVVVYFDRIGDFLVKGHLQRYALPPAK